MNHNILVIGGMGNMGKRYCKILDKINVTYDIYDVKVPFPVKYDNFTGIIIATPTDTHYSILKELKDEGYKGPILCEKPITKSKKELDEILSFGLKLRMINQYEYYFIVDEEYPKSSKPDHYDYFKTGEDTLTWDCINIIGTNNFNDVLIKNDSPVWLCQLRGKRLNIADMDWAYIWNITDWLIKGNENLSYIEKAHNKIFSIEEGKRK
jgi:hypothetical protein